MIKQPKATNDTLVKFHNLDTIQEIKWLSSNEYCNVCGAIKGQNEKTLTNTRIDQEKYCFVIFQCLDFDYLIGKRTNVSG